MAHRWLLFRGERAIDCTATYSRCKAIVVSPHTQQFSTRALRLVLVSKVGRSDRRRRRQHVNERFVLAFDAREAERTPYFG